jgi:hypothetical protein
MPSMQRKPPRNQVFKIAPTTTDVVGKRYGRRRKRQLKNTVPNDFKYHDRYHDVSTAKNNKHSA